MSLNISPNANLNKNDFNFRIGDGVPLFMENLHTAFEIQMKNTMRAIEGLIVRYNEGTTEYRGSAFSPNALKVSNILNGTIIAPRMGKVIIRGMAFDVDEVPLAIENFNALLNEFVIALTYTVESYRNLSDDVPVEGLEYSCNRKKITFKITQEEITFRENDCVIPDDNTIPFNNKIALCKVTGFLTSSTEYEDFRYVINNPLISDAILGKLGTITEWFTEETMTDLEDMLIQYRLNKDINSDVVEIIDAFKDIDLTGTEPVISGTDASSQSLIITPRQTNVIATPPSLIWSITIGWYKDVDEVQTKMFEDKMESPSSVILMRKPDLLSTVWNRQGKAIAKIDIFGKNQFTGTNLRLCPTIDVEVSRFVSNDLGLINNVSNTTINLAVEGLDANSNILKLSASLNNPAPLLLWEFICTGIVYSSGKTNSNVAWIHKDISVNTNMTITVRATNPIDGSYVETVFPAVIVIPYQITLANIVAALKADDAFVSTLSDNLGQRLTVELWSAKQTETTT